MQLRVGENQESTVEEPIKVLITDDDEATRMLLRASLSQWGYEVVEAPNGLEAWKILTEPNPPKIVLLDWMMPDLDGLTLCQRITTHFNSNKPYIIFLSNLSEKKNVLKGLDAGGDAFIFKPFNVLEVRSYLGVAARMVQHKKNPHLGAELNYQGIFQSVPQMCLILSPDFTILAANDSYLKTTMTQREKIVGRNIFDVFPDNPDDPKANGVKNLSESLRRVLDTRTSDKMAEQKYDIRRPESEGGEYEIRYWIPLNVPVLGQNGSVVYIIHTAEDVTELHNRTNEREEAIEQLRISKLDAEKLAKKAMIANRAKSAFLATMSHEIRTPLNGVVGMTDLLLNMELSPEQREYIETIRYSSDLLLNIINDILDFSKIESGSFSLDVTNFDLRELVESMLEMIALRAHPKGLAVGAFIEEDVPAWITGDSLRLGQVLKNLLDNASKFTEAGEISLRISKIPSSDQLVLQFEIVDTGIGISEEIGAQLFQPFVQGDASVTRKYGGTGLGLVICKRLVELMGGSIKFKSAVNQGTRFIFTIKALEAPAEKPSLKNKISHEITQQRILIVDDNAINRRILEVQLRSWGVRCSAVSSGNEAVALLHEAVMKKDPFSLALIDYLMPNMDGISLAKTIKQAPDISKTHLAMLTSIGIPVSMKELGEFGIERCLTKPVRQSKLFNTLFSIFNSETESMNFGENDSLVDPVISEVDRNIEILIVEDYWMNQKVILQILKTLGYHATVANNGKEALDAVQAKQYDLIFMDCQMPEMDGYTATRKIREMESKKGTSRTPIIAMTANALKGDKEKCMSCGMDDYLSKPIKMKEIENILIEWSPKRGALVIDIERLKEIFGDNPEEITSFLKTFCNETKNLMSQIETTLNGKNIDEARALIHRLKGSSGNSGANEMHELTKELEESLSTSDWTLIEANFTKLQSAFEKIISRKSI